MSLYLLFLHTHTPLVITHYSLEAAVWTESDAKLQIFVDFGAGFGRNMLHEVAKSHFFLSQMSESGGNLVIRCCAVSDKEGRSFKGYFCLWRLP